MRQLSVLHIGSLFAFALCASCTTSGSKSDASTGGHGGGSAQASGGTTGATGGQTTTGAGGANSGTGGKTTSPTNTGGVSGMAGTVTSKGGTAGSTRTETAPVGTGGSSTGGIGTGGIGTGGIGTGGATARDASPDLSISTGGTQGTDGSPAVDLVQAPDGAGSACPTGWQIVWSDEFDGAAGSAPDGNKWVLELGNGLSGWGNNELEYYRTGNANAALDGNGNLVITAKQESMGDFKYTSARLKTEGKASWMYGHIEARIKIPYGQGIWPAFWMLGDDIGSNSWPKCGEIDIMENIGSEPAINHGSLHMPATGTLNDSQLTGSYTLKNGKLTDDFHIFAVEWSASSVQFFVDGNLYETQSPATATGRDWVFDKKFFILLNLAVGGNWPGSPDSTTVFPQTMTVDYVRVCKS